MKNALNEIAESHSSEEKEIDGTMCFVVSCGCEFWMSAKGNTEELKEAAIALVQRLELDLTNLMEFKKEDLC